MPKQKQFLTKKDLREIGKLMKKATREGLTDSVMHHLTEVHLELRSIIDFLAEVNVGVIRNGRKLDMLLKNRLSYEELQELARMEVEFSQSMEKLKN